MVKVGSCLREKRYISGEGDGAYEKAKRRAESACLEHQERWTLEKSSWVQFESVFDEGVICLGEGKSNE